MGAILGKKVTKVSDHGAADGLVWGSSCTRGWRASMEDTHVAITSLSPTSVSAWKDIGFFAVMDGHGGAQVARFVQQHLPRELVSHTRDPRSNADLSKALNATFHKMDDMLRGPEGRRELRRLAMLADLDEPASPSSFSTASAADPRYTGCTAVACCITPDSIVVANAGDSRAVLCRGGKALPLSKDHKPNDPKEKKRIEHAGGRILASEGAGGRTTYRVNGDLNLSRAIGDLAFKTHPNLKPQEQMICATPDVHEEPRTPEDEFIIICCDGIWDVKTDQQCVDFLRRQLTPHNNFVGRQGGRDMDEEEGERIERALEALLDDCVSPDPVKTLGLGADNMTAVLVRLPMPERPRSPKIMRGFQSFAGQDSMSSSNPSLASPRRLVQSLPCWCAVDE